jgi:cytochrome b561
MADGTACRPRYTRTAAWLHWGGAALIVVACLAGWYMVGLPMSVQRLKWFNWHKWVGMTALLWLLVRLAWRWGHPPPAPQVSLSAHQRKAAQAVHLALYGLMAAAPLIGWAYSSAAGFPVVWLGILPLPDWVPRDRELAQVLKPIHQAAAYLLMALATVHVLAALKHQFVDRDGLLTRMKPW